MPEDIRPDIERMQTMEEIWKFLDDEYGKPDKLSTEHVAYLHTFQYSKTTTTEAAKFKELYLCWSDVHSDLTKVNQLDALNHAPTLKTFLTKLPNRSMDRYIEMAAELKSKKKSDLDIIVAFMNAERRHQKQKEELIGSLKGSSKEPDTKVRCRSCNQMGHKVAQCPSKSSHSTKKTHGTTQNPSRPCPACHDNPSTTDSSGKTFYKTRLSVCDLFRSQPLNERATIIQQISGCVLCLDWTGNH